LEFLDDPSQGIRKVFVNLTEGSRTPHHPEPPQQ
jgi:hypothetical protein